ncbi:MAG TPA: hypothetical protein VN772_06085 [Solirubrobacteraceae bacterium]|nr:hypothetical protein [Solirubrobacteraceae bacterium]
MNWCEFRRAGPPAVRGGTLRAGLPLAALAGVVCTALLALALLTPGRALAGAGVFCSWCDLNPHAHAIGNFRGHFYETETWNSDGKGVGSCSGVGTSGGSYANVACHGDASGYNEVYCTGCNGDTNWWAIMQDNSIYNSVFSGWEWYA